MEDVPNPVLSQLTMLGDGKRTRVGVVWNPEDCNKWRSRQLQSRVIVDTHRSLRKTDHNHFPCNLGFHFLNSSSKFFWRISVIQWKHSSQIYFSLRTPISSTISNSVKFSSWNRLWLSLIRVSWWKKRGSWLPYTPEQEKQIIDDLMNESESRLKEGVVFLVVSFAIKEVGDNFILINLANVESFFGSIIVLELKS